MTAIGQEKIPVGLATIKQYIHDMNQPRTLAFSSIAVAITLVISGCAVATPLEEPADIPADAPAAPVDNTGAVDCERGVFDEYEIAPYLDPAVSVDPAEDPIPISDTSVIRFSYGGHVQVPDGFSTEYTWTLWYLDDAGKPQSLKLGGFENDGGEFQFDGLGDYPDTVVSGELPGSGGPYVGILNVARFDPDPAVEPADIANLCVRFE